jgi:hypothetical protein
MCRVLQRLSYCGHSRVPCAMFCRARPVATAPSNIYYETQASCIYSLYCRRPNPAPCFFSSEISTSRCAFYKQLPDFCRRTLCS